MSFGIGDIGVSQTVQNPLIVSNGLIAYWSFNENIGTIVRDFSGNNNTGSLSFSGSNGVIPIWSNGILNNTLTFNGTSSFVKIGDNSNFNFINSTCSISVWFKTTANAYQVVIANNLAGTVGISGGWDIEIQPNGSVISGLKNSNAVDVAYFVTNNIFNDGNYHHVVAIITTSTTVNANNVFSMYIDGTSVSGTRTGSAATYPSSFTTAMFIGKRLSGSNQGFFNGSIDEVRIYNRALSQSEITLLYNR